MMKDDDIVRDERGHHQKSNVEEYSVYDIEDFCTLCYERYYVTNVTM